MGSINIPVFRTEPKFNVYSTLPDRDVVTVQLSLKAKTKIAIEYLTRNHHIPEFNIRITNAYTDKTSGLTHVYACQQHGTISVANGVANININAQGQVISSSHSFAPAKALPQNNIWADNSSLSTRASDTASLKAALDLLVTHTGSQIDSLTLRQIEAAASDFGYSIGNSCMATKALIHRGDGKVVPVWHITLQQPSHWWSAHVGVKESRIESLNDWGNSLDESYRVFPRSMLSPLDGQPQIVRNPADPRGSPHGWVTANTTVGNNVWAQSNPSGHNEYIQNYRPLARVLESPQAAVFDFPLDLSRQPTTYMDFVITQLFYTINIMHDLTFIYGFDEAAGNFQDINYSGFGAANDSIIAYAQDGRSINNALFFTPPDGQKGVMCMFIWNTNTPNRDSSLDQDIVAHEFTHGVSNRLTGGAANVDCFNGGEAGGMGEGWSDTVANILRITPAHTSALVLAMGEYSYGKGIRKYPYATNITINPLTYRMLDEPQFKGVHGIGEIWAVTLYDILWNLMDTMGIAPDIFSHDLTKGNCAGLQIILNAMKLQPCNPTFLQARDALLQAEQNFSVAKNRCALWRGFAKRGMGPNAAFDSQRHLEDFSPPDDCKTT
ncbi:hypothetical protein LPJ66_001106 [Kickxella alabastrina]|uniref:Uncharacterized protein n=1 Tax=Kickxella alabastrina TaxID=61397 RepID=A0ACC1IU67_9FUNG|nr:hypothetical protein LPJ66_001106 [Kickxella alabastrina]